MKRKLKEIFCLAIVLLGITACDNEIEKNVDKSVISEKSVELASAPIATRTSFSLTNWQANLADSEKVGNLLLPGTHDSGALRGGPLAQTQTLSIAEQLENGIRVFDIRLRAVDNRRFEIYHGIIAQRIDFKTGVLDVCSAFLSQHPTEFIILSLKKEGGDINSPLGYSGLLRNMLTANSSVQRTFDKNITVGDMRGKILPVHRTYIGAPYMGGVFAGWRDDTSFETYIASDNEANNTKVYIEDKYGVPTLFNIDAKWNVVKQNLEKSKDVLYSDYWFVTFVSGTGIFAYPNAVADRLNRRLKDYLRAQTVRQKGVVFVDFAHADLSKSIINSNFK